MGDLREADFWPGTNAKPLLHLYLDYLQHVL